MARKPTDEHDVRYNEPQMMAILNLDTIGLLNWRVELNPVMMEEWAKLCMLWNGIGRDDLVDFVRTVNDPRFLPVDRAFRKQYDGFPAVTWTVGKENSRLILADYVRTVMPDETLGNPDHVKARFAIALAKVPSDELDVTVDIHGIHVRMWWD